MQDSAVDGGPLLATDAQTSDHLESFKEFFEHLNLAAKAVLPKTSRRYRDVVVLLLRWEDDDLGTETEITDLETVFRDTYHYRTERYRIPSSKSAKQLDDRLTDFRRAHDHESSLLILYYGGHGSLDLNRQRPSRSIWQANQNGGESLVWSDLQGILERADADVVFILDCCYAATATRGAGSKEGLWACNSEVTTTGVNNNSFTRNLIEELESLSTSRFNIAMLHARLMRRYRQPGSHMLLTEPWYTYLGVTVSSSAELSPQPALQISPQPALEISPQPALEISSQPASQTSPQPALEISNTASEQSAAVTVISIDQQMTETMVLLAVRLNDTEQVPKVTSWQNWCHDLAPNGVKSVHGLGRIEMHKLIKLEAHFVSNSSLLMVSLPIFIWDRLPKSSAYSFVGFIKSANLVFPSWNPQSEVSSNSSIQKENWTREETIKEQSEFDSNHPGGLEQNKQLGSKLALAMDYEKKGSWRESEKLFTEIVLAQQSVLGDEHLDTLTSMTDLAETYRSHRRWVEAEELEVRVVEIRKRVLGSEHPDTLTSMASLASTYQDQMQSKEAEKLLLQVIETRKRMLGSEHPDTLTSMASLASTYQGQMRWIKAEQLFLQVIETRKRVLGPEHPDTLTTIASLASTYQDQMLSKEAEKLFLQVIETRKRILGSEHPDTLTSMASLASTYQDQMRSKEAEKLFLQVVETSPAIPQPTLNLDRPRETYASRMALASDNSDGLVDNSERLMEDLSIDDTHRTQITTQYASLVLDKFEKTGDVKALEQGIKKMEVLLKTIFDTGTAVAGCLALFGTMLEKQYEKTKVSTPDNAHESVSTPSKRLKELGLRFYGQYEQHGRKQDLEAAIEMTQQAVKMASIGHSDWVAASNNVGNYLQKRYESKSQSKDLDEALRIAEKIVDVVSEGHPALPILLNNKGYRLEKMYELRGHEEDLQNAIQTTTRAIELTVTSDSSLEQRYNNLGNQLECRYELYGRKEDLVAAIHAAEKAVESPSPAPRGLNNLANKLEKLYHCEGQTRDIDKAIQIMERAIKNISKGDIDLPGYLNNLGGKLESRYDRLGQLDDLKMAIEKVQEAITVPPPNHSDLPMYLNNFGLKLWKRYEHIGRIEDLQLSILKTEDAVNKTPLGHIDRAARLNNLGNKLLSRYERLGDRRDLEVAIERQEEAVKITPEKNVNYAWRADNLGNKLQRLYEITKESFNLDKAIEINKRALAKVPKNHPGYPTILNNLGNKLEKRYQLTGKEEDLDEAIKWANLAAKEIPLKDPRRAIILNNLGHKLALRQEPDYQGALNSFLESLSCKSGIPSVRVRSAIEALRLLKGREDWAQAFIVAKDAVALLPLVNNRFLNREDQQYAISRYPGLAADACALCIEVDNDIEQAISLLERGRGMIIGYLIDARSAVSELKRSHPEQAEYYGSLQRKINASVLETTDSKESEEMVNARLEEAQKLDDHITTIRKLRTFQGFPLGLSVEDLKQIYEGHSSAEDLRKILQEGSIVIVNMTEIRSDAILISSAAIRIVKFPREIFSEVQNKISEVQNWIKNKNDKRYTKFLLWLWSTCVQSILKKLDIASAGESQKRHRIWWIGVGVASFLPFHAAGDHSAGSSNNTFSQAISSYSPTIKALRYAKERVATASTLRKQSPKLWILTMAKTPGHGKLDEVAEEAEKIRNITKNTYTVSTLSHPSAADVLQGLPTTDLVHCACHGVSDGKDPSNSHLAFRRWDQSTSTFIIDRLTVRQISEIDLNTAIIAYLSACETAENKIEALADEVIHLASGFQVAGFGHVIGSLWWSMDKISVKIACLFYESLARTRDSEDHGGSVAAALHDAVLEIRDVFDDHPLKWAQYVHWGA